MLLVLIRIQSVYILMVVFFNHLLKIRVHNMNINIGSHQARTAESNRGTQSIERVVALLRALIPCNKRGASALQLAEATGIDRSTAHRILQCLAREQLLSFNAQQHRYRLGPLASAMGAVASEVIDLPALCRPALMRIADDVGDTVFLMVRNGDDAVCADRASGAYPIKTFVVNVGTRRPLGVGAGNMAILSALPHDVADLLLQQNAPRLKQYPDVSLSDVRALLDESRERGYVVMDVVGVEGVRALGVAVCVDGRPMAALSIASIALRMTDERVHVLVKLLKREASDLGRVLERHIRQSQL